MGKRSKNAEMEREIVELRRQLSSQHPSRVKQEDTPMQLMSSVSTSPTVSQKASDMDQYLGSQEAVASLLDLKAGFDGASFLPGPTVQLLVPPRRIEDVVLSHERVKELSQQ